MDAKHPVTFRCSYYAYKSSKLPYVVFGETNCDRWFNTPFTEDIEIDETWKNALHNVFILDYGDPTNTKGENLMNMCETTFNNEMKDHVRRLVQNKEYVYGPLSLDQLINHCDLAAFGVYAA